MKMQNCYYGLNANNNTTKYNTFIINGQIILNSEFLTTTSFLNIHPSSEILSYTASQGFRK